jgi:hypothetical protein
MYSSGRTTLESSNSDEVLFAAFLDNARRLFLLLKFAYLPMAVFLIACMIALNALWLVGYKVLFSNVFFWSTCANVLAIGIASVLISAVAKLHRIPPSIRMAAANICITLFCLFMPILNTFKVWRRNYQEVNGLLLIYELFPTAPPRAMASVVSPNSPLSICDDDLFLILVLCDCAIMMVSPYFLWTMIELPVKYFAIGFTLQCLHFCVSVYRFSNIFVDTCSNHPLSGSIARSAKQCQPIMFLIIFTGFLNFFLMKFFIFSRNSEVNKIWIRSKLSEAAEVTKIHFQSLYHRSSTCIPPRAKFWSRMELCFSQRKEPPIVLPAYVGMTLKMTSRIKDCGIYVLALGVCTSFIFFEVMRVFIPVEPFLRSAVYRVFLKVAIISAALNLPYALLKNLILQGRILSFWIVNLFCSAIIILCFEFFKVNAFDDSYERLPRSFGLCFYFFLSIILPPIIIRALSHEATAIQIILIYCLLLV